MVVGRSDLLQAPGELRLGKGGLDVLLRRHATHDMCDEMSTPMVVWDEEKQDTFDHPGLLKQLAQGGNYFVGEYDATMLDQFMDLVTSKGASNTMFGEMQNMPVVWDDELLHGRDCQDALVQEETQFDKCLDVDRKSTVDLLTLLTHGNETFLKEVDMDTADQLLDNLPHEVVWDEEMSANIGMHSGLLQQLAFGSESTTATQLNQSDINTQEGVLEWLALGEEYMGLLQQVSQSTEYLVAKERKPSVELEINGKLAHVDGPSFILDLGMDACGMLTDMPCQESPDKLLAWSHDIFSPGENKQQFELYMMPFELYIIPDRQWDPGVLGHVLIYLKPVLLIDSFRRYASEFMVQVTQEISSSHSSQDTTEKGAWHYRFISDVEFDQHGVICSFKKALGLQIQHHLSANANVNERTIVLKEISCDMVLTYNAFRCQTLQEVYKFRQDYTGREEDILQASYLNAFLTWWMYTCIFQSDANSAADRILGDTVFGVSVIDNLSTTTRCFSLLIKPTVCISLFHLVDDRYSLLVILSIIHPWDPDLSDVVAWGPATICEGGNDVRQHMSQSSCKMERHATVLGANDVLQHISACSLFLKLGCRKLYIEKGLELFWMSDFKPRERARRHNMCLLTILKPDESLKSAVPVQIQNYVLHPSLCLRKCSGVQNSRFRSFASSAYLFSLQNHCCELHHGGMQMPIAEVVMEEVLTNASSSSVCVGPSKPQLTSGKTYLADDKNKLNVGLGNNKVLTLFGIQKFQHGDQSIHRTTAVSKYDIEKMFCSRCLNVPWDPGGNHDSFIPAIAWGQAMFCGGGNVMAGTI